MIWSCHTTHEHYLPQRRMNSTTCIQQEWLRLLPSTCGFCHHLSNLDTICLELSIEFYLYEPSILVFRLQTSSMMMHFLINIYSDTLYASNTYSFGNHNVWERRTYQMAFCILRCCYITSNSKASSKGTCFPWFAMKVPFTFLAKMQDSNTAELAGLDIPAHLLIFHGIKWRR